MLVPEKVAAPSPFVLLGDWLEVLLLTVCTLVTLITLFACASSAPM